VRRIHSIRFTATSALVSLAAQRRSGSASEPLDARLDRLVGAPDSNLWFQNSGIAAVIGVAMVLNLPAATLSGVAIPPTHTGSLAKVEAMLHSSFRVRRALLRAP
jgi:hypothetical protein